MANVQTDDFDAVRAQAVSYCEAIHFSRPEVFETMCHDVFSMLEIGEGGLKQQWDKAGYLQRVAGRPPFPGAPGYELRAIDIAGGEMARVHLCVDVPPKRYEDHLGFVKQDGAWKLITKVFRTMAPEAEG